MVGLRCMIGAAEGGSCLYPRPSGGDGSCCSENGGENSQCGIPKRPCVTNALSIDSGDPRGNPVPPPRAISGDDPSALPRGSTSGICVLFAPCSVLPRRPTVSSPRVPNSGRDRHRATTPRPDPPGSMRRGRHLAKVSPGVALPKRRLADSLPRWGIRVGFSVPVGPLFRQGASTAGSTSAISGESGLIGTVRMRGLKPVSEVVSRNAPARRPTHTSLTVESLWRQTRRPDPRPTASRRIGSCSSRCESAPKGIEAFRYLPKGG